MLDAISHRFLSLRPIPPSVLHAHPNQQQNGIHNTHWLAGGIEPLPRALGKRQRKRACQRLDKHVTATCWVTAKAWSPGASRPPRAPEDLPESYCGDVHCGPPLEVSASSAGGSRQTRILSHAGVFTLAGIAGYSSDKGRRP